MDTKKKVVVFTGAGMSAESGINTFRDNGGLWDQYRIEDVATPDAWKKNPDLVLDFYNQRRQQVMNAMPNEAHKILAQWQSNFDIQIITQNIDDLHERAGSLKVLHLHGEIMKSRSSIDAMLIYPLEKAEMKMGEKCEKGSQLRPHIVWFGELVPEMEMAAQLVEEADILVVIGTSLNVYPAANLVEIASPSIPKYLIDPAVFKLNHVNNLMHIPEKATVGLKLLHETIFTQKKN